MLCNLGGPFISKWMKRLQVLFFFATHQQLGLETQLANVTSQSVYQLEQLQFVLHLRN